MADSAPTTVARPTTAVSCIHCGLPVPPGLVVPDTNEQFCCNGCRTVYHIINASGLDRFYRLRESAGEAGQRAKITDRTYAEFDDPTFADLYIRPGEHNTVELYLEGIHCSACVWLVEKLPRVRPGVVAARLDLRQARVEITWDPQSVNLSQIARTLDNLGYPPHPAKDVRARDARRALDRKFLIRIGVAAACAGNVMTIAFALYGGAFTGMDPQYARFFRWISLFLGLIALLWPGAIFFRGALAALRTRTAHLDLPIAIALAVGALAGVINVFRDAGEIYFDSLTMLVFLLLVGRWIQHRQQRWAADAVELLYSLTPSSVRVVRDGATAEVPIEAVQQNELAEVRAGESIPIDGTVAAGKSTVDQSLLTGESVPIPVAPQDTVAAGTTNVAATLRIRVGATGEHTRVGKLMRLVERCAQERAPIVRFADRVAGWFVVIVLALATLTFALWLWLDPSRAAANTVALLIVSCPCALGLATPLAVTVAIGQAAKRGILIKGGDALELLARPATLLLDKTGTLTQGRTRVVTWHGPEHLKPLVAALEAHSSHPIALALAHDLRNDDTPAPTITDVQQTTGAGITGHVHTTPLPPSAAPGEGQKETTLTTPLLIGSPAFLQSRGITVPDELAEATAQLIADTQTPVQIAVDGVCRAVAGLRDPLRPDANAALNTLARRGWEIRMASGDHPDVVTAVGRELGLPAHASLGGMTPEDKLNTVKNLQANQPVVMVGDGVNDAAALAAANVGLAVHGSAEASLAAADIYISRPGLNHIVSVVGSARRTVSTIRRALVASLAYNATAATLAILGIIGPLLAAILMPLSSLTVVTLAFTSRTFRD